MTPVVLLAAALASQFGGPKGARVEPDVISQAPYRQRLPELWRFHAGDDPRWAARDFDDSGWREVSTLLHAEDIPDDLERIGWFRVRLDVPASLRGQPMVIAIPRVGALEVFVDGERVGELGDVTSALEGGSTDVGLSGDPVLVSFVRPDPVLAVRFASPDVRSAAANGYPGGFLTLVGHAQEALKYRGDETLAMTRLYFLFIGVCLALALLHVLLFGFLPRQRANLYFALSTLSVAALSYFVILRAWNTSFSTFLWAGFGFSVSVVGLAVFGVRFLQQVVAAPPRIFTRIFYGVGAGLALFAWWIPVVVIYIFATLCLLEEIRIIVIGLRRGMRDMWLLAVGFVIAAIMSFIQMAPLILGQRELWIDNAYIWGFLVLLSTMSIYLAKSFARAQTDLEHRLVEVRVLSKETIAQERRAKSEEMARLRLEEENKRQAVELEQAKARQEVLTRLEATNRELRQTQAHLVQSEKMASLGQLVAGIAHEINTPIGAVHSMHDSLNRATRKLRSIIEEHAPELIRDHRKLDSTLKVIDDATAVIETGSARVAKIVQRLKTFARLDEADLQLASLEEGIEDTLLLVHHEMKHGVTMVREYGGVPPINCYPGQLNQVFLNLLVNARQSIEGEGEIRVRTRVLDGRAQVVVEDTGSGIPPDNLKHIFDPGFTTKGVRVGTGLGLSICYQIVQAHRGEIRVTSEVGKGTTFTLDLPMDLEADEPR